MRCIVVPCVCLSACLGEVPATQSGSPEPGRLVAIHVEAPGPNCAAGGQRIEAGYDRDGNALLEAAEVEADETRYVCNGVDGRNGVDGSTGAAGASGSAGQAGPTGPSGPAGDDGLAGPAGPSGPAGEDGVAGSSGPTGKDGAAGPTGASGPSAPAAETEHHVDACAAGVEACSANATCVNTVAGGACQCRPGYSGNGESCLDDRLALYGVPALRAKRILADTPLDERSVADEVAVAAAPGEYVPASFVLRVREPLALTVAATELRSERAVLPAEAVDVRVVKVWYQAGGDLRDLSHKQLVPELLLKDDALIESRAGENYVRLASGERVCISCGDKVPLGDLPVQTANSDFPIRDSSELQQVHLVPGSNKQFWITVAVPADATPGDYTGALAFKAGSIDLGDLTLRVRVLPIALREPAVEYSLYYRGTVGPNGTVSSERKNSAQYLAEMRNLVQHGVRNVTLYSQPDVTEALRLRREAGMSKQTLYVVGTAFVGGDLQAFNALGFPNVYVYAPEERDINYFRGEMARLHDAGLRVFTAQNLVQADSVADVLDLAVVALAPSRRLAKKYHAAGHKVFSYANPQVGVENAQPYRVNYGLVLWQHDYDGAMTYAYQHAFGHVWNDFDANEYRDHVFAYPTIDGVIDTVQWEGYRAAVDDVRYATTLAELVETAVCCADTKAAAQRYLERLRRRSLTEDTDMDAIRRDIVGYILALQNASVAPPEDRSCGNGVVDPGEACDGAAVGAASCSALGHEGGILGCTGDCRFESTSCWPARFGVAFAAPSVPDNAYLNRDWLDIGAAVDSSVSARILTVLDDDAPLALWTMDGDADDSTGNRFHGDPRYGLRGIAGPETNATVVHVTSPPYALSYTPGAYNGWTFQVTSGAARDRTATIRSYVIRSLENNKTITLAEPLVGLRSGDTFLIYENTAGPQWSPGILGEALALDGIDDFAMFGQLHFEQVLQAGLTVEAWVYPEPVSYGAGYIVSSNGPFQIWFDDDGLSGGEIHTNAAGWVQVRADERVAEQAWHHVALTYDLATLSLYVDGRLVGATPAHGRLAGDGCVQIGRYNNGGCDGDPDHFFRGLIDEVSIFPRALSASEVRGRTLASMHNTVRTVTGLSSGTHRYYAVAVDADGAGATTPVRRVHIAPTDDAIDLATRGLDADLTLLSGSAWDWMAVTGPELAMGLQDGGDLAIGTATPSLEVYVSGGALELRLRTADVGDYPWRWVESGAGLLVVEHRVGHLDPNADYLVRIDNADLGRFRANEFGQIAFTYDGVFGTHTFAIQEVATGLPPGSAAR